MRAKELIIGHYEGSLTPAEQQELTALLASSPEARAAYERHGVIEETLEEDARRMVVPVGLREATVAAAIGVSAEAVGWGIGGWLTGKVAAVIGTVVVGGTVMGVVIANDDDDDPVRNTPASVSTNALEEEGSENVDAVEATVSTEENGPTLTTDKATRQNSSTDQTNAQPSSTVRSGSPDGEETVIDGTDTDQNLKLDGPEDVLIEKTPRIKDSTKRR